MFRKLRRAVGLRIAGLESSPRSAAAARPPTDHEYALQFSAESRTERAERRAREYFDIIAKIEKERDRWVERHQKLVLESAVAQGMLSRKATMAAIAAKRVLAAWNKERETEGKPPVQPKGWKDLPSVEGEDPDVVAHMIERHKKLYAEWGLYCEKAGLPPRELVDPPRVDPLKS